MPEERGPYIYTADDVSGKHNANLNATIMRLDKTAAYKDLSTIILVPSLDVTVDNTDLKNPKVRGALHPKVLMNWWSLMTPPNQQIYKIAAVGVEVGEAYSKCIENFILPNPLLAKCKYLLTIETDNIPPVDGLLKLLSQMEEHPEYACIGGLYFTKGEGGQPQIWGNPNEHPMNFRPQPPQIDDTGKGKLVECNGTGMGFNLYRLDLFKDERLRRPWFKTACSAAEGIFTQDLWFAVDAKKHGYRFAIDCDIRVGHIDIASGEVY